MSKLQPGRPAPGTLAYARNGFASVVALMDGSQPKDYETALTVARHGLGCIDAHAPNPLHEAAPDLLAACETALVAVISMNADLRAIGKGRPWDGAHPDSPTQVLLDVIRKATGERHDAILSRLTEEGGGK